MEHNSRRQYTSAFAPAGPESRVDARTRDSVSAQPPRAAPGRGARTLDLGLAAGPAFVVLSADGRRLLTTATDIVTCIDLDTGERHDLGGHRGKVRHAAFSPDGARIVTVADDRTARVMNSDGTGPALAWTATSTMGMLLGSSCGNWTGAQTDTLLGSSLAMDAQWSVACVPAPIEKVCSASLPLYCFQQ